MEIVGFTEMGEECNLIQTLRIGKHKQILGSHILQLLFQGFTGFRFPIAHFLSAQVNICELHSIVLEAIKVVLHSVLNGLNHEDSAIK